jgi:hypothetical protein
VPKGYELSFASNAQSPIDSSIGSHYSYQRNNSRANPTASRAEAERRATAPSTNVYPTVASPYGALYVQGHGYIPGLAKTQENNQTNAKK